MLTDFKTPLFRIPEIFRFLTIRPKNGRWEILKTPHQNQQPTQFRETSFIKLINFQHIVDIFSEYKQYKVVDIFSIPEGFTVKM